MAPKTDTCRSCGAEIVWVTTESGAKMPMDAEPERRWMLKRIGSGEDAEYVAFSFEAYQTHFATCPDAEDWSGGGR